MSLLLWLPLSLRIGSSLKTWQLSEVSCRVSTWNIEVLFSTVYSAQSIAQISSYTIVTIMPAGTRRAIIGLWVEW